MLEIMILCAIIVVNMVIHMKNDCYVKRNVKLEMKAIWVLKDTTNPRDPRTNGYQK